ncbi:hypothetical protein HMPREF3226_02160 [Prevotella corporis]|uniref:Uncharacterized protein n=1 Tax=Prevotella corporis TaxID=28128 RepID=A0A133PXN7_9BACT|nr:hypothetical protein HMPREF3226_02160 [Prevotella corporis]
MQIIPFPTHYQSVYTNFDISSFSLISCIVIGHLSHYDRSPMTMRKLISWKTEGQRHSASSSQTVIK